MGTVVTITVVHPEADEAREMVSAAFTELERLEGILSRHRAGTPVHRLNEVGSLTDAPIELIEVLTAAAGYSDLTAGAFDVTVAPLLALFERTFRDEGRAPSPQEVGQVLERVDYRGVRVRGRHIQLARGMALTLDGIAKGYIVDRTVTVLADRGAGRVLVDAGGDMAAAGPGSAEEPWRVGVQDPNESGLVEVVQLGGDAIATSGDYMHTFTADRRHHHIVDPRSGFSPEHTSSATVVASSAMEADALSTAVLVMGPVRGLALLEALPEVEGLVVTKPGDRLRTSGMGRTRS